MLNYIDWFKEVEVVDEKKDHVQKSIQDDKFEQGEGTLSQIIDSGKCPDCGVWDMYEGPRGGMSTNIYCGNCGSHFNYCPGFVTQRIREVNVSSYKNTVSLTKQIIREWDQVKLTSKQGMNSEIKKAYKWCEDNCNGKWTVNSWHFYFEDSADAIAFKLKWL